MECKDCDIPPIFSYHLVNSAISSYSSGNLITLTAFCSYRIVFKSKTLRLLPQTKFLRYRTRMKVRNGSDFISQQS